MTKVRTAGVDLDCLHELLWERARVAGGSVRIRQVDFSRRLGVAPETMCRLLRRMQDEGRIRCVTKQAGSASRVYRVVDPEAWGTAT